MPKHDERSIALQRRCKKFLGHAPSTARRQLLRAAEAAGEDEYPDRYGAGELLESFENRIAQLLDKESAVFMPSGTMAQQIALRIHAEDRATSAVALHPLSHLLVSEAGALEALQGLQVVPVGSPFGLASLSDFTSLKDPLAAVLIELPERNLGGALRPWSEVESICEWARSIGAAAHLDGARIWECTPFYDRTPAEIAAPFDTVYVSFYKALGAIAGAALAGPKTIVDRARVWQWRHGGRLVQQHPMILSARAGLQQYLPRIPLYCNRAREIAEVLGAFEDLQIVPNPPPANMMHVYIRGDAVALTERALAAAERTSLWVFGSLNATQMPDLHMFEIHCAEGSLDVSDDEIRAWFDLVLLLYGGE